MYGSSERVVFITVAHSAKRVFLCSRIAAARFTDGEEQMGGILIKYLAVIASIYFTLGI